MKTAKTYRLSNFVIDELEKVVEHWSKELIQHPLQQRKASATLVLEMLIHQEYMRIAEIPEDIK
jgi:hypothetical protein